VHEVLVIGGGPAGLTAGMYCRMRKMSVLVVDAGRVGGQLVSLYGDKPVHDWPGYHHIIAADLAGHLVEHARQLEVEMVGNRKVLDLVREGEGFTAVARDVVSGEEHRHPASAVIIAIGGGAFEPRRLKVPGEAELGEDQLTYRMPERARAAGRRVVVVGGGDSGLESAQSAHEAGGRVTMLQVLDRFTGMETNIDKVNQMEIPRHFNTRVKELELRDGKLQAVVAQTKGAPAPLRLDCDYLVVNIGAAVNLDAVKRCRDRGQPDQGRPLDAHVGRGHLLVRRHRQLRGQVQAADHRLQRRGGRRQLRLRPCPQAGPPHHGRALHLSRERQP
jgi:thioredoxin reductase (NADPH)